MTPVEDEIQVIENLLQAKSYTRHVIEAGRGMSLEDRHYLYSTVGLKRIEEVKMYREIPVDPRTFVESPEYLDRKDNLYPVVMESFIELNSGKYDTAVLTGSIGAAKTTLANYTQAYQLYLLSAMRSPQKYFGLMDTDEIVIIMQSKTWTLASSIDYRRFRALITTAPYFQRHFMYNEGLTSELIFPKRIVVKPVAGTDTAALSQNVFSANIDEVNFMEVVERSRQSRGGDKDVFDQARELHRSITTRRESRFMAVGGRVPGLVCVISSKQYPGEFTERLTKAAQEEINAKGFTRTYLYDKRVWEIRPDKFLDSQWFQIFMGDETRQPRIIAPDDPISDEDRHLVMEIPQEYRKRFEDDLLDAMRDIAGVSTQAIHPFIPNTSKMAKCFGKVKSILTVKTCDFVSIKPGILLDNIRKPQEPRWVHIDLGLRSDSAGVSCGYVDRFVELKSELDVQTEKVEKEEFEIMPVINYDFMLEVRPPKGGEISFESIRQLIYLLRKEGVNVKWVTLDSWQSVDTLQILKQKGYIVGIISMDKPLTVQDESGMLPYVLLKTAFMDGRIEAPVHEKCQVELAGLQFDPKLRKIDHRPNGCFTGDTRVALLDGTLPTFKELAAKDPDEIFHVYSIGPQGITVAPAKHARITKTATKLVEVTLDNFQVVRCTPEHLFMTLHGEWIEAQNLTPDIPLMPLYRVRNYSGGWAGYEYAWCPVRKKQFWVHHLAYGKPIPPGHHLHHVDDRKSNNVPDNLELLTHAEHCRLHGTEMWARRKVAMAVGHLHYYRTTDGRERQSDRMTKAWRMGQFGPPRAHCSIEGCGQLASAHGLCGMHYQRARQAKLKALRTAKQQNHRVLSIKFIEADESVYDITVPGLENFALASGVFAHNSKDVSDSMAGVCRGLTMSMAVWARHHVATRLPKRLVAEAAKAKDKMQTPALPPSLADLPRELVSLKDRRGEKSELTQMREDERDMRSRGIE